MPVYVDSNAAGANNGTSWTDAYVALDSALAGIAAGTEIWAEKNHYELFTAQKKFSFGSHFANPPRLLCVDKVDDSLATGAEFEALDGTSLINISLHGSFYIDGVKFTSWAQPDFDEAGGETAAPNTQWCKRCTFAINYTGADVTTIFLALGDNYRGDTRLLEDCTFDFSSMTGGRCRIKAWSGNNRIVNPTLVGGTWFSIERWGIEGTCKITIENADLSAATAALFTHVSNADQGVCEAILRRCTVPASVSATIARPGNTLLLDGCDDGTISTPPLPSLYDFRGTCLSSLSRYRTGGADDGEQANPHSLAMATNTNAAEIFAPLASFPITRWVDAGDNQTLTVFVASGGTLNDDDFWIEVSSPNETDSPSTTAHGAYRETRCDPRSTPAALTTDAASTWNGSDVGTKQKVSVTISPAVAGPVTVRCFLAKPSTEVYVDPRLEVA